MSFATMDKEKQRKIAAMGGKAVPREKRSFSTNRVLATTAGRKGGAVPRPRTFALDREFASQCGKKGGMALPDTSRSFFSEPGLARRAALKGAELRRRKS